jgi:hypothetical protein
MMRFIKVLTVLLLLISLSSAFAADLKKSKSFVIQKIGELTREILAEQAKLPDASKKNVIAVSTFQNKSSSAEQARKYNGHMYIFIVERTTIKVYDAGIY